LIPGEIWRVTVGSPNGLYGHDEAVELAGPVDQAVFGGVRDQDVAPGATVGDIGEERVAAGVRCVVRRARVEVVVGLEVVVAVAAPQVVAVRAADEPVVADVAEDDVLAVVEHCAADGRGEVEQEVRCRARP